MDFQKSLMLSLLCGTMANGIGCSQVSFGPGPSNPAANQTNQSVGGLNSHSETFNFDNNQYSGKVDILFVVDNSVSMSPLQNNMTTNFSSFMNGFIARNFDYHLAVTTTEAYLSLPQFHNSPGVAQFRDGAGSNLSNIFDITVQVPSPIATFVTNASIGSTGSGDERAFSSIKATLDSNLNAGFLRSDSFMAIVILSDEDDFSDPNRPEYSWTQSGGIVDHDYQNPGLESVDSYVSYLDQLTGTTGASRRYSVSAMTVLDSVCQAQHQSAGSESSIIGQRYIDISQKTGGELASICDANYGADLTNIADRVIQHSLPMVSLSITPIASSVQLTTTPADPALTWTVSGAKIIFNKMPNQGTTIRVDYNSN